MSEQKLKPRPFREKRIKLTDESSDYKKLSDKIFRLQFENAVLASNINDLRSYIYDIEKCIDDIYDEMAVLYFLKGESK